MIVLVMILRQATSAPMPIPLLAITNNIMPTLSTLLALLISGLALGFLSHTDPKRRRVYKLPKIERNGLPITTLRRLMWWAVILPLPFLVHFDQMAALVIWLMAITLVGWLLALRKPRSVK